MLKIVQFSAFGPIPQKDFEKKEQPFYHPAMHIFRHYRCDKLILIYNNETNFLSNEDKQRFKDLEEQKEQIKKAIFGIGLELEVIPLQQTEFWSNVRIIALELIRYISEEWQIIFDFSSGRRVLSNDLMYAGLLLKQNIKNKQIPINITCVNKPDNVELIEFSLLPNEIDIIDFQLLNAVRSEPSNTLTEIGDLINYKQPTISMHLKTLKNNNLISDDKKQRTLSIVGKNIFPILEAIYKDENLWPNELKNQKKPRGKKPKTEKKIKR